MHMLSEKESKLTVWLAFALQLWIASTVFKPFFPLPNGMMGHDYHATFPNWLDGMIWHQKNAWSVPWFSPSFCAGQPFFPDPQSAYYALPQLLAIWWGPTAAAYLTFCITLGVVYWGGYVLMRRIFSADRLVASVVASLLMFNGFLIHRLLVGHVPYHGFALAPWLAVLLLLPTPSRFGALVASTAGALVLAYWVQSGLGTLMVPCGLAVLLLAVLSSLRGAAFMPFVQRAALAGAFGLALSAMKLWAVGSFLTQMPRTFYPLPGAESLVDTLAMVVGTLTLPSQWAHAMGVPKMVDVLFLQDPHEWAFNFSFCAVLLALVMALVGMAGVLGRIGSALPRVRPAPRRVALWAGFMVIVLVPLAVNYHAAGWTDFLKTLPIIGSTTVPLRWAIVYVPAMAVGFGLLLQSQRTLAWRLAVAALCLVGTVVQVVVEPRDFYLAQDYDAKPIVAAAKGLQGGTWLAYIDELGTAAVGASQAENTLVQGNNTMIAHVSQVSCYNPIFGYRLEKFQNRDLYPGKVLVERNGLLNLKHPACYVYPQENQCIAGDNFKASQRAAAERFVAYQPFDFAMSPGQKLANLVSLASWWLLIIFGIFTLRRYYLHRRRHGAS